MQELRTPPKRKLASASNTSQLDIARCPLCNGHLLARQGRAGPYWHCSC